MEIPYSPAGIPVFGSGTFPLKGDEVYRAVRMAIDIGVRHIDTAQMYGNENDVGRAIRDCGVARSELYVVTKVDPGNTGKDRFAASTAQSMVDLGGPADLLLIHWPPDESDFDSALDQLMAEKAKRSAKAIGVSNFNSTMLRRAHQRTNGAVINNQVEFHPLLDQSKLLESAKDLGVTLSAYSPLARGAALKPKMILDIASKLGRAPSEVVLRWIIQQGVVAIPMTTKRENALSNLKALTFTLDAEDMDAITAIGTREGRIINPSWMTGRWGD